ncbi:MAG: glycosyltransferase family 39 protein [Chloroflexi bacterium]|nr:glycosyltransferase family 39 protein [Chloroflexota bacterium]
MKKALINKIIFHERPWMWKIALALMLLAGFALRMYDLTDPPLDFAPTRQLFSAIKARGMYYQYVNDAPAWQREVAITLGNSMGIIEPPVMEIIVSQTYRLTGERLWIARIYSSFFWVVGGLALFLLIRELASSTGAAIIGTLVYLFTPYGVIASRAFQPDPLMVALIVFAIWALFRWQNTSKWKWALLFGLFGGLALLVKNLSVFIVVGGFAGVILGARGLKRSIRDPQAWVMGGLLVLPTAVYTVYGMATGRLEGQLALRFFPQMWLEPAFYFSWQNLMSSAVGFGVWTLGVVGVFLADARRERPLLLGLWIGYIAFGMTFPYHFTTHDYYHLPVIPIAALSLVPVVKVVLERFFQRNPGLFPRLVLVVLVLFGTAVQAWYARARLASADYRNEAPFWEEIGDKLGHTAAVIGLTQDYGYRLAYWGWQNSSAWFTSADIQVRYMAGQDLDIRQKFAEDTAGKQYFLVTMFGELNNQPVIKDLLYSRYPVYAETDEYVIFDLQHPVSP